MEKKSNSKRQTCVAAAERFYSKCKEKEYFQKKGRKYYQTTRSALHRIIRIELNGEVFYRLELFACLCRRRCVEYSFNQRYALGILDILQALFSNPDCSKEGRSGNIFLSARSPKRSLFLSLSFSLVLSLFRRRLSLFNQSSHADVSSLKSFLESSSLAKPPSISSFGNSICFASRSASSLPLCESASR